MKKQLTILASITIIVISSCQSATSDNKIDYSSTPASTDEPVREKTAEELKAELAQKESENPSKYLILTYNSTPREDMLGQAVVEGRIDNTATIAAFKDPVIEVDFQAPSGTSLGTKQFTRYEVLGPGYGVTYKFKAFAPDQTKRLEVKIVSATPVKAQ